jgi:hypothetical protein
MLNKKPLEEFPPKSVEVKDPYLQNAFKKETEYLKSLEADRLLAGFFETAGLAPKAQKYGGWEDTEIKGHTLGHYLSAIAQAYSYSGDVEFERRIKYIADELSLCQREDGFLFASDEEIFDRVENKKPAWVPWYTMHKIIAGLISAYRATGYEKILSILSGLCGWIYNRCSSWSEETSKIVLSVEYGGMNDCLYELYSLTGDERALFSAHCFDEMPLFEEIQKEDILNGKHANTTIPKFIGALNRYKVLGESEKFFFDAALSFWERVVQNHSYITGGNSEWEHFGEPGILDAERTNCNCETCNSYNMSKLSKELFKLTGDVKFADFYENTFINAILSSQNPETGMTMYFQPMATGYFKVYGTPFDSFWCCTGTGMENFTKLGEGIYFKDGGDILVAKYISSVLSLAERGIRIEQEFYHCEGGFKAEFSIRSREDAEFGMLFRIPDWASGEFEIVPPIAGKVSDRILKIRKIWRDGEKIEIFFPAKVNVSRLPDNPSAVAFKYGPYVLSAGLGREDMEPSCTGVSVAIATRSIEVKDIITVKGMDREEWLSKIGENLQKKSGELAFVLKNAEDELEFSPHFKRHGERYGIYWYIAEPNSPEIQAYLKRKREAEELEAKTIDKILIANDQYELEHEVKGFKTRTGTWDGYAFRDAEGGGWFSYMAKVEPEVQNSLMVKYYSNDAGRTFDILVNGNLLCEVTLERHPSKAFYDVVYPIPKEFISSNRAEIKFVSRNNSMVGSVFGMIRVLK